jgi:predicted metal-dependent hydrolase
MRERYKAMINYSLTRSKRKTICLYVRDGAVEVRAPLNAGKADIDRFVQSKTEWIKKRLPQSAAQALEREIFTLNYGDMAVYRGKSYRIVGVPGRKSFFDDCFCVPLNLTPEAVKAACVKIYRSLAEQIITDKVHFYSKKIGTEPTAVKINGATTRWGSCSVKRSLNFSWRLIMADDAVIDYVVVHELAHIVEMNHSPKFWAMVAGVLPDYKERQKCLKELQRRLNAENWE